MADNYRLSNHDRIRNIPGFVVFTVPTTYSHRDGDYAAKFAAEFINTDPQIASRAFIANNFDYNNKRLNDILISIEKKDSMDSHVLYVAQNGQDNTFDVKVPESDIEMTQAVARLVNRYLNRQNP